jgi:hypothetical protein
VASLRFLGYNADIVTRTHPLSGKATRFAGSDAAHALEGFAMIVLTAVAFLVLFSIIAVVSGEDTRDNRDPHDNPLLWAPIGRR